MFEKVIHFIKYNNLTVVVILAVFLLSSGVFAQTETGQAVIGSAQTSVEGVDNTLLLEADLDNLPMDFTIEKIEKDDKYYYVTYTFINLEKQSQAWQYQVREKVRKISLSLRQDLGKYIAEELVEEYEARIKELRAEQELAQNEGQTTRTEVVEYDGLIGKTLEVAGNIFPGYDPVKKNEIPSPSVPELLILSRETAAINNGDYSDYVDDLMGVYDDYIAENDPDHDDVFGAADNCPNDYNPDQMDIDEDGRGNACDPHPDDYDEFFADEPIEISTTTTETEVATSTPEETATTTTETETEQATSTVETNDENSNATTTDEVTEVIEEPVEEEPEVEIIELPLPESGSTTETETATGTEEVIE